MQISVYYKYVLQFLFKKRRHDADLIWRDIINYLNRYSFN